MAGGDPAQAHRIYEALGRKGEVDATHLLAASRSPAWPEAASALKACLAVVPDDGSTHFLRGGRETPI